MRLKTMITFCMISLGIFAQKASKGMLNEDDPGAKEDFPEGRLIYCSCAYTNYGLPAGNIRHSYYALIADEGVEPKVVYCEERDGDPEKCEYRATEEDISELTRVLRERDVFELNGYNVDEPMTGGTSYRIYMEFSTGEKLNATWFAEKPLPLATETYGTILRRLEAMTKR